MRKLQKKSVKLAEVDSGGVRKEAVSRPTKVHHEAARADGEAAASCPEI